MDPEKEENPGKGFLPAGRALHGPPRLQVLETVRPQPPPRPLRGLPGTPCASGRNSRFPTCVLALHFRNPFNQSAATCPVQSELLPDNQSGSGSTDQSELCDSDQSEPWGLGRLVYIKGWSVQNKSSPLGGAPFLSVFIFARICFSRVCKLFA